MNTRTRFHPAKLTVAAPFIASSASAPERLSGAMHAILTGPDGGFVRSIGFDVVARHINVVLHVEAKGDLAADFLAAEARILDAVRPFDRIQRGDDHDAPSPTLTNA